MKQVQNQHGITCYAKIPLKNQPLRVQARAAVARTAANAGNANDTIAEAKAPWSAETGETIGEDTGTTELEATPPSPLGEGASTTPLTPGTGATAFAASGLPTGTATRSGPRP